MVNNSILSILSFILIINRVNNQQLDKRKPRTLFLRLPHLDPNRARRYNKYNTYVKQ